MTITRFPAQHPDDRNKTEVWIPPWEKPDDPPPKQPNSEDDEKDEVLDVR